MKKPSFSRKTFSLLLLFISFGAGFISCENHKFDRDSRQIMAKDEILSKLHRIHDYDVIGFREDTVDAHMEAGLTKEIRYQIDFQYVDSNNVVQKKTGEVFFTPDGNSIIHSTITDK